MIDNNDVETYQYRGDSGRQHRDIAVARRNSFEHLNNAFFHRDNSGLRTASPDVARPRRRREGNVTFTLPGAVIDSENDPIIPMFFDTPGEFTLLVRGGEMRVRGGILWEG